MKKWFKSLVKISPFLVDANLKFFINHVKNNELVGVKNYQLVYLNLKYNIKRIPVNIKRFIHYTIINFIKYTKSIKSIEIVFENCDYIVLKGKQVKRYSFWDCKTHLDMHSYMYHSIDYTSSDGLIQFTIDDKFLNKYARSLLHDESETNLKRLFLRRLNYRDITQIHIKTRNGKHISYYPGFKDFEEIEKGWSDININQSVEVKNNIITIHWHTENQKQNIKDIKKYIKTKNWDII